MFDGNLNTPQEISMKIYQKTLVFILFMKEHQAGLRSLYNFRPKPIWIWNEHIMPGTNTYNEYMQYNEKEQSVKNTWSSPTLWFMPKSYGLMHPLLPCIFFWLTQPTLPTPPMFTTLFRPLACKMSFFKFCSFKFVKISLLL